MKTGGTKKLKRWGAGLLAVAMLVTVLVVAARLRFERAVEDEFAALKAAGIPATVDDLRAQAEARLPEGNGAPAVLAAAGLIRRDMEADTNLPLVGFGGDIDVYTLNEPWLIEGFRTYVSRNAAALAALEDALSHDVFAYPVTYPNGPWPDTSFTEHITDLTDLLYIALLVAAADGDGAAVRSRIEDMCRLAESLRTTPYGQALNAMGRVGLFATRGAQRGLDTEVFSGEDLAALQRALHSLGGPIDEEAYVGTSLAHYAAYIDRQRQYRHWYAGGSGTRVVAELLGRRGPPGVFMETTRPAWDVLTRITRFEDAVMAGSLRFARALAETANLPYVEAEAKRAALIKNHETGNAMQRVAARNVEDPSHIHANAVVLRGHAITMAVRLAIERYHRAHDAWPQSLGELVPEYLEGVPPDPVDGNPLRYVTKGKTFTVYSIGPDGVDNNGAPRDYRSGDVVVEGGTP